jgi:hypothetical protein
MILPGTIASYKWWYTVIIYIISVCIITSRLGYPTLDGGPARYMHLLIMQGFQQAAMLYFWSASDVPCMFQWFILWTTDIYAAGFLLFAWLRCIPRGNYGLDTMGDFCSGLYFWCMVPQLCMCNGQFIWLAMMGHDYHAIGGSTSVDIVSASEYSPYRYRHILDYSWKP